MKRMIKKLVLAILLLSPWAASGESRDVLIVESVRIRPYEEAVRGFKSVYTAATKELIFSEMNDTSVLRVVHRIKPAVILAVGMDALAKVRGIRDIPIVYIMVSNPLTVASGEANITGVSLNISPEKQLGLLLEALPGVKRVGLLYDPAKTGHLVEKARAFSRESGIELVAREVASRKSAPSLIRGMKDRIDAFWMLPDTTVVTPETTEFLFLFSLENRIPVLSFSEKYLELGAVLSVGIDPADIGKQAGEMVQKILSGTDIRNLAKADARKAVLSVNLRTARKLGITVSDKIMGKARIID